MPCSKETYYAIYVKITDISNLSEVKFEYLEAPHGSYTVNWNATCRVWQTYDSNFSHLSPQLTTPTEDVGYLWLHEAWFAVSGNPNIPTTAARKRPSDSWGLSFQSTSMGLQLDYSLRELPDDPDYVEIKVDDDDRKVWHRVARSAVWTNPDTEETWVRRVAVVSKIVVDYANVEHERGVGEYMVQRVMRATQVPTIPRIVATAYNLRVLNDVLLEAESLPDGVVPNAQSIQKWTHRLAELDR